MNRAGYFALLIIVCLSIQPAESHQNDPLTRGKTSRDKDTVKVKAESKVWRITLVSAERRDKASLSPGEPGPAKAGHYLARISLHIEYLGPDGEVRAPEFTLLDGKGTK
jgi:hypothetical protein